jgi:hypothetical protein
MHRTLNIEPLQQRLYKLYYNFTNKKTNNNILIEEVKNYLETNPPTTRINNRFFTPYEKWAQN